MSDVVVCTICSKDKLQDPGLMPAIERYVSERIKKICDESRRTGRNFRILSGKFGLLRPEQCIPYYDCLLTADQVEEMAEFVTRQLQDEAVATVVFFARPEDPGWDPYCQVIKKACERAQVDLQQQIIGEKPK